MVIGVFMAVLLVGLMYYTIGISGTILYRQSMQDAADSGAWAVSILHARGMNLVVFFNQLMMIVMTVLLAMMLLRGFFKGLAQISRFAILLLGFAAAFLIPLMQVASAAERILTAAINIYKPIAVIVAKGSDFAQTGIRYAYPLAGMERGLRNAREYYRPPVDGSVFIPGSVISGISSMSMPSLLVEKDDTIFFCRQAGDEAKDLYMAPLRRFRIGQIVSGAVRVASWFPSIRRKMNNEYKDFERAYCGPNAPFHSKRLQLVSPPAQPMNGGGSWYGAKVAPAQGSELFQTRGFVWGSPPFAQGEAGVKVTLWGAPPQGSPLSIIRPLAKVAIAQSEYYFDDPTSNQYAVMWTQNWRARLRRFHVPTRGALNCGTPCSIATSIIGVENIIAH